MPKRIQRKRTKGWRMPDNAVYVGRGTKWGNPFRVCEDRTAAEAVAAYRAWLTVDRLHAGMPMEKSAILDDIEQLHGKDLACWCSPGSPCHADVLIELANRPHAAKGSS